jgi:hypothetical protein
MPVGALTFGWPVLVVLIETLKTLTLSAGGKLLMV